MESHRAHVSPPATEPRRCGRMPGCSVCSTWHWPMATSGPGKPSITTTSGARSPLFGRADTDGNPDTEGDPTWTPLQWTYPMPDYDSGHSVEGGAAAEVLKRFFGTDHIRLQRLQLDHCRWSKSSAAARQRCCGGMKASPRQRKRTVSRGSSSAFTSVKRLRTESSMDARSATRAVNRFLEPVKNSGDVSLPLQ